MSLGGDGTMLRTVDLVSGAGVPILGINVGQLGYLTDIEPDDLGAALDRFLAGEGTIEERMLLTVRVERAGQAPTEHVAFNEAVLEKTPMGHTVRLAVEVDGEFFTTYAADGLIVATPTGSTAYAFSVRGPIVAPTHRALMLTPVSPHMLFDRTLVLDPGAELRLDGAGPPGGDAERRRAQPRRAGRGRRRGLHRGGPLGSARDLRAAGLPTHPEGEVRAERPVAARVGCCAGGWRGARRAGGPRRPRAPTRRPGRAPSAPPGGRVRARRR